MISPHKMANLLPMSKLSPQPKSSTQTIIRNSVLSRNTRFQRPSHPSQPQNGRRKVGESLTFVKRPKEETRHQNLRHYFSVKEICTINSTDKGGVYTGWETWRPGREKNLMIDRNSDKSSFTGKRREPGPRAKGGTPNKFSLHRPGAPCAEPDPLVGVRAQ